MDLGRRGDGRRIKMHGVYISQVKELDRLLIDKSRRSAMADFTLSPPSDPLPSPPLVSRKRRADRHAY